MNCPKCETEIKDNYCESCKKGLDEIYLKLIEEEQVNRNYKKALEYINILSKISNDDLLLRELSNMCERIELSSINEVQYKNKKSGITLSLLRVLLLTLILLFMLILIAVIVIDDKVINDFLYEVFKLKLNFEIKKELMTVFKTMRQFFIR